MKNPININELLNAGSERLMSLKTQTRQRSWALDHVCAALPPKLADVVVSAGIEKGQLTIGVAGAPWAARLRYVTETVRVRVGKSLGVDIQSIKIKVVPSRA